MYKFYDNLMNYKYADKIHTIQNHDGHIIVHIYENILIAVQINHSTHVTTVINKGDNIDIVIDNYTPFNVDNNSVIINVLENGLKYFNFIIF